MGYSLTIDPVATNQLLTRLTEPMMQRGVNAFIPRARANAPVDTGKLRNSIWSEGTRNHGFLRWSARVVADTPYAIFQEKGTRGSVARPGGVLAFTPKGSSTVVFAKRTGPVPATRFMQRALESLTIRDFM